MEEVRRKIISLMLEFAYVPNNPDAQRINQLLILEHMLNVLSGWYEVMRMPPDDDNDEDPQPAEIPD